MRKLYFKLLIYSGALNRAIRRAKRKHNRDARRYRVFYLRHRFRVWNRDDIRRLQRAGKFKNKKAGADFDLMAFFDTNSYSHKSLNY